MFIKQVITAAMLAACIGCGGEGDLGGASVNPTGLGATSASTAIDAGTGFVFAISEKFSDKPLGIVDSELVAHGEPVRFNILSNRDVFLPYRHGSGTVTVTERCFKQTIGTIEYRRIASLTSTADRRCLGYVDWQGDVSPDVSMLMNNSQMPQGGLNWY